MGFRHHRTALAGHLKNRGLRCVILMGFVLMGSFVTLYNYVGYRLIAAPFNLSQTEIGAIFVVYLTGVVASPWSGKMADIFGRGRVLIAALLLMIFGVALTLSSSLPVVIAGIACMTFGFFAGHSVASGWIGCVGQRAERSGSRAVFAGVLHRLQRAWFVGWALLDYRRLAGRKRLRIRAAVNRFGRCGILASAENARVNA